VVLAAPSLTERYADFCPKTASLTERLQYLPAGEIITALISKGGRYFTFKSQPRNSEIIRRRKIRRLTSNRAHAFSMGAVEPGAELKARGSRCRCHGDGGDSRCPCQPSRRDPHRPGPSFLLEAGE